MDKIKESENKSSASQIIEPIIKTVVNGTRARPIIMPAGARTPKVKLVMPAVARKAPQEAVSGCKIKSGAFPENRE
jgi:hypothetical protein